MRPPKRNGLVWLEHRPGFGRPIPHARREEANAKRPSPGRRGHGGQLLAEGGRVGDRQATGEVAAEIGGWSAVDQFATGEQRDDRSGRIVRRWPGRGSGGSRRRPRRQAPGSPHRPARRRSPVRRFPRPRGGPPRANWRTPSGSAGGTRSPSRGSARRPPGNVASPVSAASRSRTDAAIELPAGTALSWTSFGRVTSASWSSAVSKNPPSRSANRSRIVSARDLAIVNQRSSDDAS